MRREHRLRRSADFERARTLGRTWSHPLLLCCAYYREDDSPTRVGIIVGKRTGKAVVRNRVKRRIREAARALYRDFAPGWDVILIPKPGASETSVPEFLRALDDLLARAGIGEAPEARPKIHPVIPSEARNPPPRGTDSSSLRSSE